MPWYIYLRRLLNLDEPDELLQILEATNNFRKVSRLNRLNYPTRHKGMRLIGVYTAALKDNEHGLFTTVRLYRSTIAPYVYHAVWTYGDNQTPDALMNLRNKTVNFFTVDEVGAVVAEITATLKGVAAVHKSYTAR